jgi:hypothetical protein
MDTQIEEDCVESTNNYLIDEEEDLLKLKNKILDFFEEEYVFDHDFDLDEYIREALEKYQRHPMALKQIPVKQEEEIKRLKTQVNEKEESCHKLEAKVVDLRRKEEKSKRFINNSTILDEILDCQRYLVLDKTRKQHTMKLALLRRRISPLLSL